MSDRDRAYRILGLDTGASREEIDEAYEDLKAVWHPDRFADKPELQAKARERQKAVENAYQALQEDQEDKRSSSLHAAASPPDRRDGLTGRGPSILDDTLSERIGKSKRRRFPIWTALFALVAVAVVISFLRWSPVDVESDSESAEQETISKDLKAERSVPDEVDKVEVPLEESPEVEEVEEVPASTPPSGARPEPPVESREVQPSPSVEETPPSPSIQPAVDEPEPEVAVSTEEVEAPEDQEASAAGEEETAISELAERSFQILRAKSDVANQLVEGSLAGFTFKDWKALEQSPNEVYVDLIAEMNAENREMHFVWSVDVEAQSVKPMSQAARDLQVRER